MNNKIIITVILISILVLVSGAYFLGKSENNASSIVASSYTQSDKDKPQVESKENSYDLGKMKVSEERYHDFIVKNIGNKLLQFSNIKSSCMCTAGKIIYKGQESQEFGMHAQEGSVSKIAPGENAIVRVIYRPFQMPVYGPIEREVSMSTNDPSNQQLIFKITAIVE